MQEAIAKSVNATRRAAWRRHSARFSAGRWTWRCRRSARPAASRSAATGCARPAGRSCRFIAPPYCERLGIPFAYDPGPGMLSMQAIADPPAYHRARAAVRYDDVARALVHALKYGDRLDLAPMHGPLDGARRARTAGRRRRARAGAAALAAAVGAALQPVGRCWPKAIAAASGVAGRRRARSSASRRPRSRSGCRSAERAANVQGAFRVPAERKAEVAGRRLVLVDDVLTSGATVDACARALLRAGAAQRRRAGVRPGCRRGASPHINWLSERANARIVMASVEIYTTRYLPLLHRRQGAADAARAWPSPRST